MEFGADKTDVKSLSLEELQAEMVNIGEKPFRAKQLYEWFHKKLARDYDEMRNIPKSLKEKLESGYTYTSLKIVEVQTSQIDGTKKYLFSLADGNLVESVSNVVVMGTGEPLDNYDSLLRFIRLLTDENGLNISQRNITVSTCGIVENMKRLADENLQITLALSLHGATQEKRRALMPIADK